MLIFDSAWYNICRCTGTHLCRYPDSNSKFSKNFPTLILITYLSSSLFSIIFSVHCVFVYFAPQPGEFSAVSLQHGVDRGDKTTRHRQGFRIHISFIPTRIKEFFFLIADHHPNVIPDFVTDFFVFKVLDLANMEFLIQDILSAVKNFQSTDCWEIS